jgi:hypothetical protein
MKNKTSEKTLENVEDFSVPIESHPMKWKFEDEGGAISEEFKDQIIPLDPKAAKFLWKFESTQRHLGNIPKMESHYKNISEFYSGASSNQEVKKWLYNLGIPFNQKVFWIDQPQTGFVLTWKIIIKYSDDLFFGSDAVIWDKTLNWCLNYHHHDMFHFGKDRLDNAELRSKEIKQNNELMQELLPKHRGK